MNPKDNFFRIAFFGIVLFCIVFFKRPTQVNLESSFIPPFQTISHPLGTDRLGRDLCALFGFGAVGTILFSIPLRLSTILVASIFVFLEYSFGKIFSFWFEPLVSIFLSIPSLFTALMFAYFFGGGILVVLLSIVVSDWAVVYESLQAKVREVKDSGFCIASVLFGNSPFYIFKNHIFPEIYSIQKNLFLTGIPSVIMTLSLFSYLGIDTASEIFGPGFGEQISFSKDFFSKSPLSLIIPIIGISSLIFFLSPKK
ncbi:MAG: ABC transporter permease [Leptospiraceae bacterium]|nr:ABC transporter permease [Leptospiraceae bacterium]MCK6380974.1 ABC transporter permease [Leptospiraceae bacterium]NUM41003.1 ABC transporter permease [Leptospiraceae bacterium]